MGCILVAVALAVVAGFAVEIGDRFNTSQFDSFNGSNELHQWGPEIGWWTALGATLIQIIAVLARNVPIILNKPGSWKALSDVVAKRAEILAFIAAAILIISGMVTLLHEPEGEPSDILKETTSISESNLMSCECISEGDGTAESPYIVEGLTEPDNYLANGVLTDIKKK